MASIISGAIPLPNTNLMFCGKSRTTNGIATIKLMVSLKPGRAYRFSVQLNEVQLRETYRILRSYDSTTALTTEELGVISCEVTKYVKEFGSNKQKSLLL